MNTKPEEHFPRPGRGWVWAATAIVAGQGILLIGLPHDHHFLTDISDTVSFVLTLIAAAGFARCVTITQGRSRAFFFAFLLGALFRCINLGLWMYYEVVRQGTMDVYSWGNTISFLQVLPLLVGTALRPHRETREGTNQLSVLDVFSVSVWWISFYTLAVLPWRFVARALGTYNDNYGLFYAIQHLTLLVVLNYFARRSERPWRIIYRQMFFAGLLYSISSTVLFLALRISADSPFHYFSGSVYDIPLNLAFLYWGWIAVQTPEWLADRSGSVSERTSLAPSSWAIVSAALVVLSLPAISLFVLLGPAVPPPVRDFRLVVAATASLVLTAALLTKLTLLHRDLFSALRRSETAYAHLHEVQGQLLNAEKLASLSRLVAGTMHEINNPLAAIHGYSDLLASDTRLDPVTRGYAEKLRHNARRTKQIVQDLLAFGRPNPPGRNPLELAPLIDRAVSSRRLQMESSGIVPKVNLPSDLPMISGDEAHLLQALVEIIDNAIQAMHDRAGTLHISASPNEHQVAIYISDSGPGITQPDLVFDPFYTTRSESGAKGLGLSVAYGVIRDHGGRIRCFNRPEGGATFEILLPTSPAASPVATAHA